MKTEKTYKIYGVFGYPLKHTLSPVMHETAFKKKGIKAFYLPLEQNKKLFQANLKSLKHSPLDGFNITVPYKEVVAKAVDILTPEAKTLGAVNTVYRKNNKWVGTNTDVDGFLCSLKKDAGFNPKGKKVLILGAGGAARAVAYGLAKEKAKTVFIANRTPKKARAVAEHLKKCFKTTGFMALGNSGEDLKETVASCELVVNATSLGLKKTDSLPISKSYIGKAKAQNKKLFFDLVYNPEKTVFLKAAREKGHRTMGGKGMLVYQGALAWEIWTKKKAPVLDMRRALDEALAENN